MLTTLSQMLSRVPPIWNYAPPAQNMGQADITQIFSVWGRNPQSSSAAFGSQELSRALIKFPIATVSSDRSEGKIPASGSVNFYLRMFNAYHTQAVPEKLYIIYTRSVKILAGRFRYGHDKLPR